MESVIRSGAVGLLKKACKKVDSNEVAGGTAAIGTLPQLIRRNFRGVSYDEAMRRAREIVPILRERAQRADEFTLGHGYFPCAR